MRGRKGLLHNLSILSAGQVVSQLANVAVLIYLADQLGARDFGIVQIGVAFMGYAMIAAEWGMFSLGVREVSRMDNPHEIRAYARGHCGMLGLQALTVFLLGLLILPYLPFFRHDPVVFIIYLVLVLPQVYTQSWLATGIERLTWVGLARIVRSLAYAGLIFLLLARLDGVAGQPGMRWVPLAFLLATLISNLVVLVPLGRLFGGWIHPGPAPRSEYSRRWRETASIGGGTVVLRVLFNIDIILLGILASPEDVGHYAAAAKIMFVLVIAVEVLWAALLPRLSRLARLSPGDFRTSFNLYLGTVSTLLFPVALGGWLVGDGLIALFYKGEFAAAVPVFKVLAVSYTGLALATFLGNTLISEDRQRRYLWPLVVSSVVAVLLVTWLVPRHGILGAAWGILCSHALLVLVLVVLNRAHFNILLGQTLLATVPALVLMYLVLTWIPGWHVVLRILLGGAVYVALAAWPLLRLRRLSPLTPVLAEPRK
jgi:O-antigen/teichoic acid export membrane protein